jgi:hypothetical protein
MPHPISISGSDAGYPNTSGSQQMRGRVPNSALKNAMPSRICRISDSPLVALQSASIQIAPVVFHCPAATHFLICA